MIAFKGLIYGARGWRSIEISEVRMQNVIRVFMLVDTNERYREVSCVKCTRACHRNVN